MKANFKSIGLGLLLIFVSNNISISQEYNQTSPKKTEQINALFNQWTNGFSPGASIAIIDDGKIVFANSYGFSSLEYKVKNTPETLFNINSNSKQFTTYALVKLMKQGKIKLDDNIRTYLPELPDFGHKIEVRDLAQYTHGIRGITPLLGMAGWSVEDLVTRDDVLKLLTQQNELDFSPKTGFSYNNTGYMLLAEIIERVSGQPFHEYLDEIIFTPLTMDNTQLYEDYEKVIPNLSSPYYFDGKTYKRAVRNFKDIVGNTGIRTNVIDLSKWLINLDNPKVGGDDVASQLLEPTVLSNGDTLDYCLGLKTTKYNGRTVIKHGGADIGYRSQILRFPEEGVAIIVLCNNGSMNADKTAYDIANIYLDSKSSELSTKTEGNSVFVSDEQLSKYVGKFELQPGFIMEFNKKEDGLMITATGQGTLPLKTLKNNQFEISRIGAIITFVENEFGKVDKLTFNHQGQTMEGNLITYHIEHSILESYCGTYFSSELKTYYQVVLEKGNLKVKHRRQETTELTPLDNTSFSGNTWFFGTIEFILDDNTVKGLKASSGRAQNVWFEKVETTTLY